MRDVKSIIAVASCCAILGCDFSALKEPPIAITFRQGVLSRQVVQVNNLSALEGVEVYLYVANETSSVRSGNVVVPANSAKEFGALEVNWGFKAGDKGFVCAVRYGKKLFFELLQGGHYRTWFGYDDIREIDVAAQVSARQIAEHEAWLKAATKTMSMCARSLFDAIERANIERTTAGRGAVWPKPPASFKGRATSKIKEWKDKITGRLGNGNEEIAHNRGGDIAELKFKTAGEYFDRLFDVRSMGTAKHSPYVTGIDIDVVSTSSPKGGSLPSEAVRWSILADVSDEMSSNMPIFVSANFPCEKLRSFWDGKENADEIIPLAQTGDTGNEAFIVVFKDGSVKAFSSDCATLSNIYTGAFNTCTNGNNRQVQYITPKGVVNAAGEIK